MRPRFQMSLDGSPVVVVELLGQCLVGTLTGKAGRGKQSDYNDDSGDRNWETDGRLIVRCWSENTAQAASDDSVKMVK